MNELLHPSAATPVRDLTECSQKETFQETVAVGERNLALREREEL